MDINVISLANNVARKDLNNEISKRFLSLICNGLGKMQYLPLHSREFLFFFQSVKSCTEFFFFSSRMHGQFVGNCCTTSFVPFN